MVGRARVVTDRTPVRLARIALIAPGLLVFVAAIVLVTTHRFDGLYGQDAFGYVNFALGPLRDAFLHGGAIPSFQQPPGFPIAIAAISLVAGPDGRLGLAVSLLAGALVPVTTALLASEAIGRRVGGGRAAVAVPVAAAVIASLPGQLWQSSSVAMSDTLAVALATTGAWAACRYGRTGRSRWLLLAAGTVAAAIDTRWVDGLVAVPIAAVAILGVRTVWGVDRWRAIRDVSAAALVGAIVLAPVAVPMGLAVAGGTTVPFAADFGAYAWDPLNVLRTSFTTSDGHLTYATTSGAFYLGQAVAPYWFGPPGLLSIWGAVWVARHGGLAASILLIGWPIVVVAFLAGSGYQNTRFFLATMPPVAILVALGTWRLARIVDGRLPRGRPALRTSPLAAAAVAWVLVAVVVAGRFTASFIDRQTADLAAIRRLEAEVPPGARLIAMGPTGVFVHDGVPDVVELFDLDPVAAAAFLGHGRPSYLVVDPAAVAGQWAGRIPALTVAAIRADPGLTRIDDAGMWTLYRIGSP